jgi:hypothetical protein
MNKKWDGLNLITDIKVHIFLYSSRTVLFYILYAGNICFDGRFHHYVSEPQI